MDSNISFSNSIYLEQETREDAELFAFTRAVTDVFGSQQAVFSERDWLDESDSMDTPPLSVVRNWRAVSVAASFRLGANEGALAHLLSDDDQPRAVTSFSKLKRAEPKWRSRGGSNR
jgi:hypothetical protein